MVWKATWRPGSPSSSYVFPFHFPFFGGKGGGGGGGREGDGGAAVNVCFFIASLCFSFISTAYPITIKNELS